MPKNKYVAKTAKGTRDIHFNDVLIYNNIINTCKNKFILRGAKQIDTPIFELEETFKNLYGEEEKLIYHLSDNVCFDNNSNKTNVIDNVIDNVIENDKDTKEQLALRYDLTVPLARYVATHGIDQMKRFQIGKVYRRDKPQMDKGRYCEFYQCDYDIIGSDQNTGIYETEILELFVDVLKSLLGDNQFKIRFNDRTILFNILRKCGVKSKEMKTICSSLDKLDKHDFEYIKDELLNTKKIAKEIVDKINSIYIGFVTQINSLNNNSDVNKSQMERVLSFLIKQNSSEHIIVESETLSLLTIIVDNLKRLSIIDYFQFDLTLIRGLDYYTGIIYEAEHIDKNIMPSSIGGGGRYDKMIGKLQTIKKKGKGQDIPAIGMSIGVERIFTVLKHDVKKSDSTISICQVYVVSPKLRKDENTDINKQLMVREKLAICQKLRQNNISCDMFHTNNAQLGKQFAYVDNNNIPYILIVGLKEIKENKVNLKNNQTREEQTLSLEDCIRYLQGIF